MNARALVAIILAAAILASILGSIFNNAVGDAAPLDAEEIDAWKVTLAAIIGALSVYIAGKDDE